MENNEVLKQAAQFLLDTAKQGKAFIVENGPEALQQWMHIQFLDYLGWALFGIVIIILGALGLWGNRDDADEFDLACGLFILLGLALAFYHFKMAFVVSHYPAGFLLETLTKGH